jgi:hypothetical protein
MRRLALIAVLGVWGSLLSSCVVRERPVMVARPAGCPGGVWVEGHRHGGYGRYHQGHWRCPGVVDRIEINAY